MSRRWTAAAGQDTRGAGNGTGRPRGGSGRFALETVTGFEPV